MVGEGVQDLVSSTFHTAAEAVVLSFVVVVTHVSFWLFELNLCLLNGDILLNWSTTLVLYVVSGLETAAVVSLSDVDLRFVSSVVSPVLGLASLVVNVNVFF